MRAVFVIAVSVFASIASAHLGSTKYIDAAFTPTGASLSVSIEQVDVAMQLGLGEDASEEAIAVRRVVVETWLVQGITLTGADGQCAVAASNFGFERRNAQPFVTVLLSAPSCAGPIQLRDDTIFDDDAQHESLVHFMGDDSVVVLRRGARQTELVARGMLALVREFLVEGMLHFALGFDHILFLLSLILAAGFTVRRESAKAAARDIAWVVTAFTFGHSITLIAAALDVVVLPSGPVEVAIALSIMMVAALNILRPEQKSPLRSIGFVFGLIHGFGFSGVLLELGLPTLGRVSALLAFNVGIELAQLAFVLVVFAPLVLVARTTKYVAVVRGSSALIGLMAAIWVVERVSGL